MKSFTQSFKNVFNKFVCFFSPNVPNDLKHELSITFHVPISNGKIKKISHSLFFHWSKKMRFKCILNKIIEIDYQVGNLNCYPKLEEKF